MGSYCSWCGKDVKDRKYYEIKVKTKENIVLCERCWGDVYKGGKRYTVDVATVPVGKSSLNLVLEEKVYIQPQSYMIHLPKFLAFYETGKGQIQYIGKVKRIVPRALYESVSNYISNEKETWTKERLFKIFRLSWVRELERPIKREESGPIQSREYIAFQKFSNATTLKQLRE